ncbi:hypothetical protein [Streptomyces lydicus]|uniref:hypothetical protein n=1 Tax=Streptomyces lydicus TaxID=47763 RepID=UPI001010E533|nr:hypothetical protein [Streptomyces lydicus]MCZ1012092.1 hypothetical protein [Streptomyces lydicus]
MTQKRAKKTDAAPEALNLYTALAAFLLGLFNASLVMLTGLLKFLRKEGSSFFGRVLALLFFGYLYLFLAERRPAMYTALFFAWVIGCFVIAGVQAYGDARAPKKTKKAKKAKKKDAKGGEESQDKTNLQKGKAEPSTENDHERGLGERDVEQEAARHEASVHDSKFKEYIRRVVEAGAARKLSGPDKEGKIVSVTGRGARLEDILRGLRSVDPRYTLDDLKERLADCGIRYKEQMKFQVGGKPANVYGINLLQLREDLGLNPRQAPPDQVPDTTHTGPSRALTPAFTQGPAEKEHEEAVDGAA